MADIKVYGAPWCPDCRRSKQFLGEMRVHFDWIDIDEDPGGAALVREKNEGRQIIPTIVFADGSSLAEPTNAELAAKLGLSLTAKRTFYDLIIVGGGPTGLTTAIYAAREGIDCLIVERGALGGQAGATDRIDNYPGFPDGIGGAELAERFIQQAHRYGVETLAAVAVDGIERLPNGDVGVKTSTGDEYAATCVLIATGSTYRHLDVPGEEDLIGAGIHFCATCDGPFYKGSQQLLVIGGGNSGVEEALFLTQFTDKVTLIETREQLGASALLQERARREEKIEIRTATEVLRFDGKGHVEAVTVRDRGGATEALHPQGVFIFIGLTPNAGFLGATVNLDRFGFIETDATFQTSMAGVFAAGDVRAGSTKQLASAVGEGATALIMVRNYLRSLGEVGRHNTVMA